MHTSEFFSNVSQNVSVCYISTGISSQQGLSKDLMPVILTGNFRFYLGKNDHLGQFKTILERHSFKNNGQLQNRS